MKSRPGIVMMAEKRKYQRLLPMMSNTPRLAPDGRSAGAAGYELFLGHAVQRRTPSPLLGDDPAQDRPGDDDRAEHRDEHADDQHEREAADHRRSEDVQDRRGDQTRHVRVE